MARRDRVHCRTSRPARTRRRAKPLSAPPTPANARGAKLEDGLVRRRCGSWRFPQYWRPRDGLIGPEAARPPELWPAVVRPAFGRPFLRPCCGPGESFFGLKISGRRHGVRPRTAERASPACAADGARRGPGTIFEEKRLSGKKSALVANPGLPLALDVPSHGQPASPLSLSHSTSRALRWCWTSACARAACRRSLWPWRRRGSWSS